MLIGSRNSLLNWSQSNTFLDTRNVFSSSLFFLLSFLFILRASLSIHEGAGTLCGTLLILFSPIILLLLSGRNRRIRRDDNNHRNECARRSYYPGIKTSRIVPLPK